MHGKEWVITFRTISAKKIGVNWGKLGLDQVLEIRLVWYSK